MLLYSCKLGYVVGTYISRTYAAGISPVVEHPVAELDGVVDVIMEQVLGDPAACLGVPHPEHILLRRPRPAAEPPGGGRGGGDVHVHRLCVDAVAPPAA
jgi:hypothetical protein